MQWRRGEILLMEIVSIHHISLASNHLGIRLSTVNYFRYSRIFYDTMTMFSCTEPVSEEHTIVFRRVLPKQSTFQKPVSSTLLNERQDVSGRLDVVQFRQTERHASGWRRCHVMFGWQIFHAAPVWGNNRFFFFPRTFSFRARMSLGISSVASRDIDF